MTINIGYDIEENKIRFLMTFQTLFSIKAPTAYAMYEAEYSC